MKSFAWILLLLIATVKSQAQDVQVTLIDPCATIDKKSTIIINDNVVTANLLSRTTTESNSFNFTLTTSVNTSAGVYNASGTLVRTLWNGVRYDAGSYKALWSGTLDDGTQAPPGTYEARVLTNNVTYTWEGVIGNSSTDFTGDYILKGNEMEDICFVGTKGFMVTGYSEHGASQKMVLTSNVYKIASERYNVTTQSSLRVCTDGNIVYYAGYTYNDNEQNNYFIFGAYPSDNGNPYAGMATFSSGIALNTFNSGSGAVNYASVIGLVRNNNNAFISSVCVQKSGNLLFATKPGLNQLQIFNKTTGALLQAITYTSPTSVTCDDSGNLYMVYNNVLHKFLVTASGVLTDSGTSFTGINSAGYIDISPDYSTIAVADNGSRQVKFFSNNGGASTAILGTGISYTTNPYVDNYKFYLINFIRYQPDGSIWVGDKENYRYLHFNTDRTYKEQMAWVGESRSSSVDPNNPNRVFSGFVEFERDYFKTLDNGTNGSWKLKANWKAGIFDFDNYGRFKQVVTLTNNNNVHTYAPVYHNNGSVEVYELTATGARATGLNLPGYPLAGTIGRDGTLFYTENVNNDHINIHKKLFTGFSNSNPSWASDAIFVSTPSGTNNEYNPGWAYEGNTGFTANSDKYVWFNYAGPPQKGNPDAVLGYHLGAIKSGNNNYTWKTSRSTFTDYPGSYPTNGDWDIGNGWPLQHSLTHAMVYDHDIFFNANGEFWKNSQINIWNHFYDDGLLVGHFGTAQATYPSAAAKMAGNAFGTAICKIGNDYYVYHCDESVHAGVHSWYVTGLNTIAEQSIPVVVSAGVTIPTDPGNLMTAIPFRSTFFGGNRWTVDKPTSGLSMRTGLFQYQKESVDVQISGSGTQVVKCAFNNNSNLNSWTLSGGINMQEGDATVDGNNFNYLEILDSYGKIIARFQAYCNVRAGYQTSLLINSSTIADGAVNDLYYNGIGSNFMDFTFKYTNNNLTFKIGSYNPVTVDTPLDIGASKAAPTYLRISQSSSSNKNHAMDLCKLRFIGN